MNAKLYKLFSPDIIDFEKYTPKNDSFCFLIQAFIGPSNEGGKESFEFTLCSPKWLERELDKEKLLFGKGFIVMSEFNYFKVRNFLSSLCTRTHGNSWDEIAIKLSRYGNWEFEDYIPYNQ